MFHSLRTHSQKKSNQGTKARSQRRRLNAVASRHLQMEPLETRQLLSVAPTIGILTASHEWRSLEDRITLAATNLTDAVGTIQSVSFYHDANQDGSPQASELIQTDTISSDGWMTTFTDDRRSNSKDFLAVAMGNNGISFNVASPLPQVTVAELPMNNNSPIQGLIVPYTVRKSNGAVDLAADVYNPSGDDIGGVAFYRDVDGDGLLNPKKDTLIGIDREGHNGWNCSDPTANLAVGSYTYFAATIKGSGNSVKTDKYYAKSTVQVTDTVTPDSSMMAMSRVLSLGGPSRDLIKFSKSSTDGDSSFTGISYFYAVDSAKGLKNANGDILYPGNSGYDALLNACKKTVSSMELGKVMETFETSKNVFLHFDDESKLQINNNLYVYDNRAAVQINPGTINFPTSWTFSYKDSNDNWNPTLRIDTGNGGVEYGVNDPESSCCGGSPVDPMNPGSGAGSGGNVEIPVGPTGVPVVYDSKGVARTLTVSGPIGSGGYSGQFLEYVEAQLLLEGVNNGNDVLSNCFYYEYVHSPDRSIDYTALMDISSYPTGHYIYDLLVTRVIEYQSPSVPQESTSYSEAVFGAVDIVNRWDSMFGVGCWLKDMDELVVQNDGVLLVRGDNSTVWYAKDSSGDYVSPTGTLSHIEVHSAENELWIYDYGLNSGHYTVFAAGSGAIKRKVDAQKNIVNKYEYKDFDDDSQEEYVITDSLNRTEVLEFDSQTGLVSSITDFDGRVYSLGYQDFVSNGKTYHKLVSTTVVGAGGVWGFEYNSKGLMTSVAKPNGASNTYEYSFANQLEKETYHPDSTKPEGTSRTLSSADSSRQVNWYNIGNGKTNLADPILKSNIKAEWGDQFGRITTATTNKLGRIISQTDPLLHTTTYVRDDYGHVITKSETSPNGMESKTTTSTYDSTTGNVTSITSPDGSNEQWTYDGAGRLTQHTRPGQTTYHAYGSASLGSPIFNTTTEVHTDGNLITTDQCTNRNVFVDGNGDSHDYSAEDFPIGLVVQTTDPLGSITEYDYGVAKTDGAGNRLGSYGQVTRITRNPGPRETYTSYQYDSRGNRTAMIDELGRRTDYLYDSLNRLVKTIGPYRTDSNNNAILYDTIVDNPSSGTNWTHEITDGYNGDYLFATSSSSAEWAFGNLTAGKKYEVLLTWVPNSFNTTNASYAITGGNLVAGTLQTINQTSSPSHPVLGSRWQTRGVYQATGTSITVSLSYTNGRVVADAVRLVEVPVSGAMEYQHETNYEYNNLDEQTAVIDAMGNRTETAYCPLGVRQTKVTEPDPDGTGPLTSPVTVYGYDRALNNAYTVDPVDRMTTYDYDELNRQVASYSGVLIDNSSS